MKEWEEKKNKRNVKTVTLVIIIKTCVIHISDAGEKEKLKKKIKKKDTTPCSQYETAIIILSAQFFGFHFYCAVFVTLAIGNNSTLHTPHRIDNNNIFFTMLKHTIRYDTSRVEKKQNKNRDRFNHEPMPMH